ncbi:MAG: hypothetical protein CGW95_06575 [Phenylobacterium zucineum]|nr:MAG: hypothetical protein CGW95_06575 [Phenylobacterium zucineum]
MTDPKPSTKWWKTEGVLGQVFQTQESLKVAIRAIVNPAPLNTPLPNDQAAFLMDVLKHHHDWAGKRGAGVSHIEVRMNPGTFGSTRGLWLSRVDGSEIDISWVVPLKPGGRSSPKENVCAAARREIMDQVLDVRKKQEGGVCCICGHDLVGSTHVDHAPPVTFDVMLTDFLRTRNLDWSDVEVQDMGVYAVFKDRKLADDWQLTHSLVADLRLIHKHENLSIGARG